ncbi:hypothetical protein POM88_003328 [Heracleum sosnowskyi]|uniref:Mitochondrial glycoprotein n=1 Tax=Heracleum sosnowskyi TaxID=360622 RepID=A0AAD8JIF8_9APIA|nr:hypothetical protein POM88_003328 [Heracleum sosnowskyi]
MAAATILLRRSSAYIKSGSQFYSRYLSTASKRSSLFVPTAISSVRQFCSSPVVNTTQTPSSEVKHVNNINQQPVNNDQLVREILSQLGSMKGEIESLRKANEERKEESPQEQEVEEEEVVVVKEKHPLLKEIESVISKAEFKTRDDMLAFGFEVECDKPGVSKVTLKKSYKKEIINIELFSPTYDDRYDEDPPYEMKLIVKVGFSRIFSSTVAEFHCTASDGELLIDKIKDPSDGPHSEGVMFRNLPESLQSEFYEYLQIRGVYDLTSNVLHTYMVDKIKRENMRTLGKFKKLVDQEA